MRLFVTVAALLFATACATTQPSLEGSTWSAEEINGDKVERQESDDPECFSIKFAEEDRIAAMGACNRIMGNYNAVEDGTIEIKSVGSTMMFCPNLDLEESYIKALESATKYVVEDDQLTLYSGKEVVVKLERVN